MLQGALSRNRKLSALRVGDIISTSVLERINKNVAVLNLFGNKINTFFEGGVPKSDTIKLKILFKSDEQLRFRTMNEEPENTSKPLSGHLGIALPLLRQLIAQKEAESVYDLLLWSQKNDKEDTERKRRRPRDCAREVKKIAEEDLTALTANAAAMLNEYSYLLLEDETETLVAGTIEREGLYYAVFELGDSEIELTARQNGSCSDIFLYCDDVALRKALSAGCASFGERLRQKGIEMSLQILSKRELFDLLLVEIENTANKNIVDYTA